MAITGNDLIKKRRGSTTEEEKEEKKEATKKVSGEELLKMRKTYNSVNTDIVDQKYIDSFINDSNAFLTTAEKDYGGLGWANASSSYDSRNTTWQDLNSRADTINVWLNKNRNSFDKEAYDSIVKMLDDIRSGGSSIMDSFKGAVDYYSKWESEDEYNSYLEDVKKQEADRKAMLEYDSVAGEADIKSLEATYNEAMKIKKAIDDRVALLKYGSARAGYGQITDDGIAQDRTIIELRKQLEKYGDVDALGKELQSKRVYHTLAGRLQNAANLASVGDPNSDNYAADFEKYAGVNNAYADDRTYKYINNIDGFRLTEDSYWATHGTYTSDNGLVYPVMKPKYMESAYEHISEDEKKLFNYYYEMDKQNGTDLSLAYLNSIQETLNYRKGQARFESIKDKEFLEMLFGVEAGLDQFKTGIENLFSNADYIPASSTQIASGMVREDLADNGAKLPDWLGGASLGQVAYDSINTTANMLPSIMVSFVPVVGQAAGAITLGASAAGHGKAEMLNLGYSKAQANFYGAMVGASEAGLQYLLGGITKLGGKASQGLTQLALSKVDNALARVAITLGMNMASEGFEESLQTVIEPWLKSLATGVDFESPNIDEVLYSGLLGSISALFLEGGTTIAGEVKVRNQGANLKKSGVENVDALVGLGKTFEEGTSANRLANNVNENSSAYTIGRLLTEVGSSLSERNMQDIASDLQAKGMSSEAAKETAKWLYKAVEGGHFNRSQQEAYVNDDRIADVHRELFTNEEHSVHKRNAEYESLYALAQEVSKVKPEALAEANEQAKNPQPTSKTKSASGAKLITGFKEAINKIKGEILYDEFSPDNISDDITDEDFIGWDDDNIDTEHKDVKKHLSFAELNSLLAADDYDDGFVEAPSVTENAPVVGNATESKFEVSENGKTMLGDTEVSIKDIASTKDGEVLVRLEDGSTVKASDIDFASNEEGLLYQAVANKDLETANEMISLFKSAKNMPTAKAQSVNGFILGFNEAHRYGELGIPFEALERDGEFSKYLVGNQAKIAYNRGVIEATSRVKSEQNLIEKTDSKKGKITFDKASTVGIAKNGIRAESLKLLKFFNDNFSHANIHFYASYIDSKGRRVYRDRDGKVKLAPNGKYLPDGTLAIDLNAGSQGQGLILDTVSHELTHMAKDLSPEKWKAYADFLFKHYSEGHSVEELVQYEIDFAKKKGRKLTREQAYDEAVARASERMLVDVLNGTAQEKIAELNAEHKDIVTKIKEFFEKLIARIKGFYNEIPPESRSAQIVHEMEDVAAQLRTMWLDMIVDAGTSQKKASAENDIIKKDLANKDILHNERFAEDHLTKLQEKYSSDASIELDVLTERYNKVLDIWHRLGGELNSKFLEEWNNKLGKDRAFTVFKAQAGYKYNVELSSMCKKGVPLFEAIDTIVKEEVMKELDTKVLGKEEKEILYDILKSKGFDIPCAICYVEQARQREGVIIDAFLNGKIEKTTSGKITQFKLGWNEVLKEVEKEMKANGVDYSFKAVGRDIATEAYSPVDTSMDETTQEAFYNALKKVANKEITRYNEAEKKNRKLVTSTTPSAIKEVFKGTLPSNLKIFKVLFTDPSSRFTIESDLLYSSLTTHNLANSHNTLYSLFNSQGGVAGYKTKQGTVVYWGDILGKSWTSLATRKEGGIRNQSNSDFQMYTLLDQVQLYIDFTAKGYYLQAYTKVLAELKLFGKSNGKINASLIPAVYEYKNADGSVDVETTRKNAGLDRNGNLLFDDIEGINHNEAFMLLEDAEYSKSIGGICIGYSDKHIFKLLDDNRIQQIIGFHDKTDDPNKRYRGARYAKNYNGWNEASKTNKDGKTETIHIGFNPYVMKAEKMFTFNKKTETYEGEIEYNGKTYVADDIPRLAADLYLEMCESKGYTPAYADFSHHKNYYKLLADFSLYDSQGHYAPHKKVAFNMPDKVPYLDINGNKKYMSTKDYIKTELEQELKVRDSIAEALTDKEDGIIPRFKKAINERNAESEEMLSDRDSRIADTQAKITARYKRTVDKVMAGTYGSKDNVLMGYTPEIFRKLGMPSLPFVINADHIYSIAVTEAEAKADALKRYNKRTHYHGLGVNAIKTLYSAIHDPVMIIAAKDTDNKKTVPRSLHSVVAIIDVGNASEHLLMPVEITAERVVGGININVNALSSSYMRKVEGLVQEAIAQTNIGDIGVYYMKKEATNLLDSRVSFPKSLTDIATSFGGIIHQFSEKINMQIDDVTKSLQFTDWFGDWQNYPKNASKVVNADGTPMVVYHGSKSGNIKTFKTTNRNGTGGLYLTTNRSVAEVFAGENGEVYENYVNLRTPLIIDANGAYYDSIPIPSEMVGSKYAFGSNTVDTNAIAAYARDAGYDGVIVKNVREVAGFGDAIIAFESNQVKSVDNVGTFDKRKDNSMYSDRSSDSFSNRSLLANALESVAQNDIERNKLKEYKNKIALIESEQAKLAETRAKIKELSFAKGKKDTEAIKKLQFEANQSASRINTYDRQLLNLEATKALKGVLEREKALAYKKAEKKGREALEKSRERAAKTQRELMTRYQESRKKGVEGRHKTEMRYKIKKVVNELNEYLKNTKDKHVPIHMQKVVAEALDAVNMDTVGAEERIAKKFEELRNAKSPEQMAEISKTIYRLQEMGGNIKDKLSHLKTAYDDIINSDDPLVANSHDEVISNTIAKVIEVIEDTPLRDMELYQLEAVHSMYRMILSSVRNANKTFKANKKEEISTLANQVIADLIKQKKLAPYSAKAMKDIDKFMWDNLKPIYAFERIGSNTFTELYRNVRAGEDVWARDMAEADAFRESMEKMFGWKNFDLNKKYDFVDPHGQKFTLRLEQIMSIYAFAKRGEDAIRHLKNGGFQFDKLTEIKEKKGNGVEVTYQLDDPTVYKLSDELLVEIISVLDEVKGAKSFADKMQDYLSSVMGEKGNEVSLAMYEIKLFNEENYFPLKVSHDFLERAREQAQGTVKVKNSGFTNPLNKKAVKTIVLSSFMDVWTSHVNEMAMYHAFTLPLEDFYRVFNYSTPAVDTMETMSVISSLREAHRDGAVQYIDQLLKDLNGGAVSDSRESIAKKAVANFKKAKVMTSLSVVIQQTSAIVRATSLLDAKYFVGKKVSKAKMNEKWEKMKKYAPVVIIKDMGYFDTGMGKGATEWLKGNHTLKEKIDDFASYAPALMDKLTWIAIWNAVERETLHTHKNLRPNSEEFLNAVGERFTEVIEKTQVYDSTLSRSANMRSKSVFMQMATSFMAEGTTSVNMLEDALRKGKKSKKQMLRIMGSVYGSVLLNSALVSLVYAMRDDDEDETYIEKYLSRFTSEMIDGANPLTNIPLVKDIWSLAQGYDIERADMSLASDLIDSMQRLTQTIATDTSEMDEEELAEHRKGVTSGVLKVTDALAALFGYSVGNVRRELNGIIYTFTAKKKDTTARSLFNAIGEEAKNTVPVWGWLPDKKTEDKLYKAIIKEDEAYVERFKEGYESEKSYTNAVRRGLRRNDPRIKEAAKAVINGDFNKYDQLFKEILREGYFTKNDIKSAIDSSVSKMSEDKETSDATSSKEVSIYETEYVFREIMSGDTVMAQAMREDIIRTKMANGSEREDAESSFNNSLASYVKKEYEEGNVTPYEAKQILVGFGGKTEEKANAKIQYWDFQISYPDYDDLSESAVEKYYTDVKPSGISIDVYYDYSKQRAKCKGMDADGDGRADSGTVKAEAMHVIDSLPLTHEQKDVLYYLNGWSASTIWQAPWH